MNTLPTIADYGQLRAFISVARTLSFTRAASKLGVSASALSQTVRGLEERIGIQLLNRTTRSVSLTEAGSALLQRVSPALGELSEAMGQIKHQSERPIGLLRIHSFRIAGDLILKPILRSFLDACPEVVLDLTLDDEVIDLVAEGYDAGVRIGEVIERDMIAVRLGSDLRQVAVASPGYIERYGRPQSPRDLHAHRCIGWRWPGHDQTYKWEFYETGQWFELTVDGPLIVNSREFGVCAALEGVGIAFAINEMVAPHIQAGTLVPLFEGWSASFPGFFICFPVQRQMAPAVRAFIDALTHSRLQDVHRLK